MIAIARRIAAWMSSLKVAISLLIIIAICSSIGTTIPQNEPLDTYINLYRENNWLGILNGELIILLQLNKVYSSFWFLSLLIWLSFALMICSWRRQWPILKSAFTWIDYTQTRQIDKLSVSKIIQVINIEESLMKLSNRLDSQGWSVQEKRGRIAARKGVIGRAGPPIIHLGLVLIMIGAGFGALTGERIERFLEPGNSLNLINQDGINELTFKLKEFNIDRDPSGRPEQFQSILELINNENKEVKFLETSVNHPLRLKGMTIYQADWSLSRITIQLGNGTRVELPLKKLPELGEEIWGVVLPTTEEGKSPILLSASNEKGPVKVFNEKGELLASLRPSGGLKEIKGIQMQVIGIGTQSGLILKRDPGVPFVYCGFGITLMGGFLSLIATKQLWAVSDLSKNNVHIGGLSNRDLIGLSNEIPELIDVFSKI